MITRGSLRLLAIVGALTGLASFFAATGLVQAGEAALDQATVIGTILHQGNPVAGVEVTVTWQTGSHQVITGADGTYTIRGVPTGEEITLEVHPPAALRLAFRNWRGTLTGDLVMNFDLVSGYRLEGEYRTPDGSPYTGFRPQLVAVGALLPAGEFLGPAMNPDGSLDVVLPPGFYAFIRNQEMEPYFLPPTIVDLRQGDLLGKTITLSYRPAPMPAAPPIADEILVGPPDEQGWATVSAAPGSVPPLVAVLVANLSASTLDVTASDASGAFAASLFAPPGSSLLIKYDPTAEVLAGFYAATADTTAGPLDPSTGDLPSLPGTMIYAGAPPSAGDDWQAFDSAAGLMQTAPRGWAGLQLSGVLATQPGGLPGMGVLPGETITVTADLRLTSPDVMCTLPITFDIRADLVLHRQFAADGHAYPGADDFSAYLLTPTGLPIEHNLHGEDVSIGTALLQTWSCAGPHVFQSDLTISASLPPTLPEGIWLPLIRFHYTGVPLSSDLPLVVVWYHTLETSFLPPLRVGAPAPPRLPMALFADYPSNGHRGVPAREDQGLFHLQTWVTYPPQQVVLPRLDERTGESVTYQLEPGSNWLSLTDRRLPHPLHVPFSFPSGSLTAEVVRPDLQVDVLGPATLRQSSLRTPTVPGGSQIAQRTGTVGDVYHLDTGDPRFAYSFPLDGPYTIHLSGEVEDIYGNVYLVGGTYDLVVARILDLAPAQLPGMPYYQGDSFAPGLHINPPVAADVTIQVVHLPFSDPAQAITHTISGRANRFGYFQPEAGAAARFEAPGEFRVDVSAAYVADDGALWIGSATWGNVVEGTAARIEAHGRRGLDYTGWPIDDQPAWFFVDQLPTHKLLGVDTYVPYFSGDIYWGRQDAQPGDSIQPAVTIRDTTGASQTIYDLLRDHVDNALGEFRRPPTDEASSANLEARIAINEAPLFLAADGKRDPAIYPEALRLLAYGYNASERPNARVREVICQDMLSVGYWGFQDTYNYQIGVPADGDQPGDIKWNFGGAVLRTLDPQNPIAEYGAYASFWVLLPDGDPVGPRITPPFQDAVSSINGGPILVLGGQEIDMLFLPRGVSPGDLLEVGDTVSFSGHVGPPLDSRVDVTITSPGGVQHSRSWHADKIGWLYDSHFDFVADEAGRWTVDVLVEHDRPYLPTGLTPATHNTGTVLGSGGRYEFYVVEPDSPRLFLTGPQPGFLAWPNWEVEPILIRGVAPTGTTAVHYTIYDKGVVMGQGTLTPGPAGEFVLTYDAEALHADFPMLSLTAREGRWEGLADEVSIRFLAVGGGPPRAAAVTLIGEEVFVENDVSGEGRRVYLPLVLKSYP